MVSKIKLVVNGACGKMGRQIITCALKDSSFELVGALDRAQSPEIGQDAGILSGLGSSGVKITDKIPGILENADVVIDFSSPESSVNLLHFAAEKNIPLVVGTTGFTKEQDAAFQKLSKKIRCVKAPNMSVGVNLLFELVSEAAKILGDAYDVEVVEAHHHLKKDAPSGTAKKIVEILAKALGRSLEKDVVTGRNGLVGERKKTEIGVFSVRAGDIVGDHTVLFAGCGERLELIHRAHSRETFAQGALRAAKFIVKAELGLYSMQDVLGMKHDA